MNQVKSFTHPESNALHILWPSILLRAQLIDINHILMNVFDSEAWHIIFHIHTLHY